jgi:hypothetical protein
MGKQNAAITSTMTRNQVTRSSQSMMGPNQKKAGARAGV